MITINDLQKWGKLLNLTELARLSDIPFQRLYAKVKRGSDLTTAESERIEAVLLQLNLRKCG